MFLRGRGVSALTLLWTRPSLCPGNLYSHGRFHVDVLGSNFDDNSHRELLSTVK